MPPQIKSKGCLALIFSAGCDIFAAVCAKLLTLNFRFSYPRNRTAAALLDAIVA
jgi:hypothetical protein